MSSKRPQVLSCWMFALLKSRSGHIPGSENVPLQVIDVATGRIEAKDTPVFVYCQSGGRSSQAAAALKRMGYSCVKNIGGIASYSGTLER